MPLHGERGCVRDEVVPSHVVPHEGRVWRAASSRGRGGEPGGPSGVVHRRLPACCSPRRRRRRRKIRRPRPRPRPTHLPRQHNPAVGRRHERRVDPCRPLRDSPKDGLREPFREAVRRFGVGAVEQHQNPLRPHRREREHVRVRRPRARGGAPFGRDGGDGEADVVPRETLEERRLERRCCGATHPARGARRVQRRSRDGGAAHGSSRRPAHRRRRRRRRRRHPPLLERLSHKPPIQIHHRLHVPGLVDPALPRRVRALAPERGLRLGDAREEGVVRRPRPRGEGHRSLPLRRRRQNRLLQSPALGEALLRFCAKDRCSCSSRGGVCRRRRRRRSLGRSQHITTRRAPLPRRRRLQPTQRTARRLEPRVQVVDLLIQVL
mmetsp:Transcript_10524/g.34610  ORF Transcript_10524/g.34610 Transcript_10524/m.34610 type:complete len:379 (+) Transcript_10524:367-1503(+)